ncbi:hypothetical protein BV25DRAFT_1916981 [Artomyces pyxidatus]|uniref:Uncharacterized protein n=1 Tax=Artomyces pyxidatus TaxID=48021 RepID=A0ACB8SZM5_9AGAM|nr:hypothetical protein BV25DRAFT_1916981 [Artomyces pyxidatus]
MSKAKQTRFGLATLLHLDTPINPSSSSSDATLFYDMIERARAPLHATRSDNAVHFWVDLAECARHDARQNMMEEDFETSFVEYAKMVIILLEIPPSTPEFLDVVLDKQRENLTLALDALRTLKASIHSRSSIHDSSILLDPPPPSPVLHSNRRLKAAWVAARGERDVRKKSGNATTDALRVARANAEALLGHEARVRGGGAGQDLPPTSTMGGLPRNIPRERKIRGRLLLTTIETLQGNLLSVDESDGYTSSQAKSVLSQYSYKTKINVTFTS